MLKAKKQTRKAYRRNKLIKKVILWIMKEVALDAYYIVIGLAYIALKTYVEFEKAVIKVWKGLPFWFRRLAVWMILLNVVVLNSQEPKVVTKVETKTITKEVLVQQPVQNEVDKEIVDKVIEEQIKKLPQEERICKVEDNECYIREAAKQEGLDDNQTKLAVSISKWETGNFKSNVFNTNKNFGGLYDGVNQHFFRYTTKEEGAKSYVVNLKRGYFDKGLNTIEEIQKKYAPVNAKNDPTGLNKNWVAGVRYFYTQMQ